MRVYRGFTLIELLLVVVIVLMLAAVLCPVLVKAGNQKQRTTCLDNLHQIGIASLAYATDYDGALVPATTGPQKETRIWSDLLRPYRKTSELLACPAVEEGDVSDSPLFTYAINNLYWWDPENALFDTQSPRPLARIEDAAHTVFCADSTADTSDPFFSYQVMGDTVFRKDNPPRIGTADRSEALFVARHSGGFNAACFDGHSVWLPLAQATQMNSAETRLRWFTPVFD